MPRSCFLLRKYSLSQETFRIQHSKCTLKRWGSKTKNLQQVKHDMSCFLLCLFFASSPLIVSGLGVGAEDVTAPKNSNTKCHEHAFLLGVLCTSFSKIYHTQSFMGRQQSPVQIGIFITGCFTVLYLIKVLILWIS